MAREGACCAGWARAHMIVPRHRSSTVSSLKSEASYELHKAREGRARERESGGASGRAAVSQVATGRSQALRDGQIARPWPRLRQIGRQRGARAYMVMAPGARTPAREAGQKSLGETLRKSPKKKRQRRFRTRCATPPLARHALVPQRPDIFAEPTFHRRQVCVGFLRQEGRLSIFCSFSRSRAAA